MHKIQAHKIQALHPQYTPFTHNTHKAHTIYKVQTNNTKYKCKKIHT